MQVDDLAIVVTRKAIKNVYLRIDRSTGQLRLSAPLRMQDADIAGFVSDHRAWIDRRRRLLAHEPTRAELCFVTGERHLLFGEPFTLHVIERPGRGLVRLHGDGRLELHVSPDSTPDGRAALLSRWYRAQLAGTVPRLIERWEPVMGVAVSEWRIRAMTTRWGTCNIRAHRIWLNLELAKYPIECLEYVVVHEMNHLLERGHTKQFHALMDQWLPDWRRTRKRLADRAMEID